MVRLATRLHTMQALRSVLEKLPRSGASGMFAHMPAWRKVISVAGIRVAGEALRMDTNIKVYKPRSERRSVCLSSSSS